MATMPAHNGQATLVPYTVTQAGRAVVRRVVDGHTRGRAGVGGYVGVRPLGAARRTDHAVLICRLRLISTDPAACAAGVSTAGAVAPRRLAPVAVISPYRQGRSADGHHAR